MRVSRLGPLMLSCCLLSVLGVAQQKPADDSQEMKDINKTFADIKKAHDKGAADDSDEIKKLKAKAIELVDTGYKIPQDNAAKGSPSYDPKLKRGKNGSKNEGSSSKDGKKVKTRLGEDAFTTPGWLASTKLHELVGHGGQAAGGRWYNDAKGSAINEIECYDLEIANAEKNGLSKDDIADLKKRRQKQYDKLDADNKKKVDKKDYTLAMLVPSDRSVGELAGTAQVFVAGTVVAEEVTEVTVRGPRSFDGVVVEVEANGKQVKTTTDSKGHARIDLAALGALADGTTATVRALDSSGKPLATGQTKVQPETVTTMGRPQLPKVPAQLRNGDVITLKGSNLGAETKLVVGNQVQETLAASAQEITAFVNSPTGQQSVYAVTPFGVSQSQNSQLYSFNLAATKSTITRGEHITASAQYAGLPPGSEIKFTNATPDVVSMQAQGAAITTGQQCTVKVGEPNGSVSLDLLGQSAGKFVIKYEIKFPE